jgi:hypothetical protein
MPSINIVTSYDKSNIRWRIDNNGGAAKFKATAQKINEHGLLFGVTWPIRWEGTEEEFKQINSGDHAVLEIACVGREVYHPHYKCITFNTAKFVSSYSSEILNEPEYSHMIDEPRSVTQVSVQITITADRPLREPFKRDITIQLTKDGTIAAMML